MEATMMNQATIQAAMSEIPECVTSFVLNVGIPATCQGFNHLRTAIYLAAKDPTLEHSITKRLYPMVAERWCSTDKRVERTIRHAIEKSFERFDWGPVYEPLNYYVDVNKGKLTNSEFITLAAMKLRPQIVSE